MFVYTIQPVVKPFVKPGCQTSFTTGFIVYTNIQPFDNRIDYRLYRVYSRLSNQLYRSILLTAQHYYHERLVYY